MSSLKQWRIEMKLWFQSYYMRQDAECQSEDGMGAEDIASLAVNMTPSCGVSFKAVRDDLLYGVVEDNNSSFDDLDEDELVAPDRLLDPTDITMELQGPQPDIDGDDTVEMDFILRDVRFPDEFVAWGRIYSRELPGVRATPGLPEGKTTLKSEVEYLTVVKPEDMVPECWEDLNWEPEVGHGKLPVWQQFARSHFDLAEAIRELWVECYTSEGRKEYVQGGTKFALGMQVTRFLTELTRDELRQHVNDFMAPPP